MKIKTTGEKNFRSAGEKEIKREVTRRKDMELLMWRALTILEAAIIQNIRTKLRVGTGTLMNSISGSKEVHWEGDTVVGSIGPESVPYAAIHEFGGIITPKRAKWLTIPDKSILGPDRVARMSAREAINQGYKFLRIPGEGLVIGRLNPGQGPEDADIAFRLRKRVRIPARPYMRPAFEAKKAEIEKKFGLFLQQTVTFES